MPIKLHHRLSRISDCMVGHNDHQVFLQFPSQCLSACFFCFSVCRMAFFCCFFFCSSPSSNPSFKRQQIHIPSVSFFFCHPVPHALCIFTTSSTEWKTCEFIHRNLLAFGFSLLIGGGHWDCRKEMTQNCLNSKAWGLLALLQG